jgi:hypothetical protein
MKSHLHEIANKYPFLPNNFKDAQRLQRLVAELKKIR